MSAPEPLPFLGHLEEFRRRLLWCVVSLCVLAIVSYFYSEQILEWLWLPAGARIEKFYFTCPTDAFGIRMKLSLFGAAVLCSPIWSYHIWQFFAPALEPSEKRYLWPLIVFMAVLFCCGVLFCYFQVLSPALDFFLGLESQRLQAMILAKDYLDFVIFMLLGFGAAFNLPVMILGLAFIKVLTLDTLLRYKKHATIFIFILAAVLTPGPDIASQLMMAVPLLCLYVLSCFLVYIFFTPKKFSR